MFLAFFWPECERTFTYRPGGTPPDMILALVREHDAQVVAIVSDATNETHASGAVRTASLRGPIDIFVQVVGPIVVGQVLAVTGGLTEPYEG